MRTNSEPVTPTTASLTPLSIALGALAAGLGSLAVVALGTAPPIWLAAGVGGGALVAASVGPRAVGAGRGLMWGIAVALLGWLVVPLLGAVPLAPVVQPLGLPNLGVSPAAQLALLPRGVLGIGVPAGAVVGWWHGRRSTRPELNLARALATGGIAGILGGAAFGVWLGQAGVFPRIAGIIGVDSVLVGQLVHFGIASTIGVSFAILFQRDVQGYGSALGWGVAYGLFWWLLGSATLFPLLRGVPVDWSAPALTARFGSLVGHLLFGILLGVVYGVADRLWCLLFYESDPINRAPVGPAVESLRAARWGALASLGGGLLFGGLLWRTGQLSTVGALVGVREPAVGFVVHLGIASIIGMSYGQLGEHRDGTSTAVRPPRLRATHRGRLLPARTTASSVGGGEPSDC